MKVLENIISGLTTGEFQAWSQGQDVSGGASGGYWLVYETVGWRGNYVAMTREGKTVLTYEPLFRYDLQLHQQNVDFPRETVDVIGYLEYYTTGQLRWAAAKFVGIGHRLLNDAIIV